MLLSTDLSFLFLVIFLILKVLLGLQLLAGKAQTLQENDSKFFVKGKLNPLKPLCTFSDVNAYISVHTVVFSKWTMDCIFKTF